MRADGELLAQQEARDCSAFNCESARPRMTSATVWLPVLPPMLRDDRHQRGQRRELRDRALEDADDARGDEGREQVEAEPDPALARARARSGRTGPSSALEAHLAQRLLERVLRKPVRAPARLSPSRRPGVCRFTTGAEIRS